MKILWPVSTLFPRFSLIFANFSTVFVSFFKILSKILEDSRRFLKILEDSLTNFDIFPRFSLMFGNSSTVFVPFLKSLSKILKDSQRFSKIVKGFFDEDVPLRHFEKKATWCFLFMTLVRLNFTIGFCRFHHVDANPKVLHISISLFLKNPNAEW